MPHTQLVRIERYCKGDQQQEGETFSLNTKKVRDYYATKKDGFYSQWPIKISACIDYLQIVTLDCDAEIYGTTEMLSPGHVVDTATIYPDGMLCNIAEAREAADKEKSLFFGKQDVIEKFAAEKAELLVVTRGGNIKAFDRERDLILRHTEDYDVWNNITAYAKARALINELT